MGGRLGPFHVIGLSRCGPIAGFTRGARVYEQGPSMTLQCYLLGLTLVIATVCSGDISRAAKDLEDAVGKVSAELGAGGLVLLDGVRLCNVEANKRDTKIAAAEIARKQPKAQRKIAQADHSTKLTAYSNLLKSVDYIKYVPGQPKDLDKLAVRDLAGELDAAMQLAIKELDDERVKLDTAIAEERKAFFLHKVVKGINDTPVAGLFALVANIFGPFTAVSQKQLDEEWAAMQGPITNAGVHYDLAGKNKMVADLAQNIADKANDVMLQRQAVEAAHGRHMDAMELFVTGMIQPLFQEMAALRKVSLDMLDAAWDSREATVKLHEDARKLYASERTVARQMAYKQKWQEMATVFTNLNAKLSHIRKDLPGIEAKAQSTAAMGMTAVSIIPRMGLVPAWELMLDLDEMISVEYE